MTAVSPRIDTPGWVELIGPLSISDFVARYWGREAFHSGGDPQRFAGLFSLAAFRWAARAAGAHGGGRATGDAERRPAALVIIPACPDEPLTLASTEPTTGADLDALTSAGRTIYLHDIDGVDETLARLAKRLKRELRFPGRVSVNSFYSPDGSGADLHLDARVTMTLQIDGRKRWRFGRRPAISWPLSNAQAEPDGTPRWMLPWAGTEAWEQIPPVRREELDEVVVEPGDVLCLPAGTWHEAKALGHSLALSVSFQPIGLLPLLTRLLGPALLSKPEWREGIPAAPDGADVATRVGAAVAARLRELADAARALDPYGDEVRDLHASLLDRDTHS